VSGKTLETFTVRQHNLDDFGLAEDIANRIRRQVRIGVNVYVVLNARSMAPGFADRLVSLLRAEPTRWMEIANVQFDGKPEVLAVLKRALGISPLKQPEGGK
jgi:hypothetical protein